MTFPLVRGRSAIKRGYRSGLEDAIAASLKKRGVGFTYEQEKIPYTQHQERVYTPDFFLPNGIIIETKGYFTPQDRVKHLLIQRQHPEKDIRFVFQNAKKRLSKVSKTTYAKWAEKYGFKWAEKDIPDVWIKEKKAKVKAKAKDDSEGATDG